jgi:hypothetical protein
MPSPSFNQLQLTAHGLAAAMGVAALVGACAAFAKGLNPVMATTLLVVGVYIPWLTWMSLHKSRVAWSFLIATVSVFGAVCLFGSPKIRDLLGVDLGVAAIIPFAQIACVVMLSMLSSDYKERAT